MSEWNSKNKPGVKTRDPEYPDLTTDFADPSNDNNQYRGKDNLVGWYRFLGDGAVGRVDGGTTNTFPNLAKTGSDGQSLSTGVIGSALYYEEGLYGSQVTYKAHYQSPFDAPIPAVPSQEWGYSFNQQVTPYLPTNMVNGALPFSGSKAEKNYFRITDISDWDLGSTTNAADNSFTISVWVRKNDYVKYQQADTYMPIVTSVKNGGPWASNGQFSLIWIGSAGGSLTGYYSHLALFVHDGDTRDPYARSAFWGYSTSIDFENTSNPQSDPAAGEWIHVVGTYNGGTGDSGTLMPAANSADSLKIFVNGKHSTYDLQGGDFSGWSKLRNFAEEGETGNILINCGMNDSMPTNATSYTNQDIAEVAFWNRVLSPREIKALYNGSVQGIKKWDSGLVKNPARPQLQRLDDTDGNAYPTIAGSANQERLGKRTPYFDDTLTRVFLSSSALAAGDITMGARLPTDDRLLSASFSTPNKLPSLVVSASQRSNTPGHTDSAGTSVPTWGIDPRIMGNLPFLTASVTEFKDPIKPYDDSKYYIDNNVPFYVSSSIRMPGFNSRVDNKVMITIDTNPSQDSAFGICQQPYGRPGHANMTAPGMLPVPGGDDPGPGSSDDAPGTDYGNEAWFMGYWNNDKKRWERIGRGWCEEWAVQQGGSMTDMYYSMFGSSQAVFNGSSLNMGSRTSIARNIDQACIGFPAMNQYIFSASAGGGDLTTTMVVEDLPDPKVQFVNYGRPITNYGFPFHGRYEATGSQLIKMSDYIDRPFLVEKIIIEYSGSHDFPNHSQQSDLWRSAAVASNVTNTSPTVPHFQSATSFFILRQRADKFEISGSGRYPAALNLGTTPATRHDKPEDPVPNFKQTSISVYQGPPFQAATGKGSITSFLTGAIPGKAFTNPSDNWWNNPQSNKTLVTTTRDLVTYAQHVIHGFVSNITASYNNGNDFPMTPADIIEAGMGRDLNTYVPNVDGATHYLPANRAPGPWWSNKTMKPFGFSTANQLTGSYILSASCRASIKTGFAGILNVNSDGVQNQQSVTTLDNLIGGRMNPAGQLGDRRPLVAGLPSGKISDVPLVVPSRGYLADGSNGHGTAIRPIGLLSGSTTQQVKDADSSPYLLMPGDKIILGVQAPFFRDPINAWCGGQAPGTAAAREQGSSINKGWKSSTGFSVGLHPGAGKFILIGSYIKDHKQYNISSNQQLTTPSVHGIVSDGPVLDQWEIDSKMSYSGSYLDNSVEGAMTSPTTGWPREPFKKKRSHWAAASSMASGSSFPKNGPWDGYLKPWVARDSSGNAVESAASDDVSYSACKEPASTRWVGATAFAGSAGDVFGFQRNVRLDCPDETYYDSLVPDPSVCWVADNQPYGWGGAIISETLEADNTVTLGIGASNGGNQAGTVQYSNEWWLPSFPFEARYRGFSEPPGDDFKRKIEQNSVYMVRLCLPNFPDASESWQGFDAKGTNLPSTSQSAKCVGVVGVYVDGLKPGTARSAGANWGAWYSTIDKDMNGTILPVLFGIGNGLSGSVAPYKRAAAVGTSTTSDGGYKYLSNKPSGCKYGLYSWKPRTTSTIFRSNKFGQMRDMLEQRRYSRFYIQSDGAVESNAPVVCQFKEPIWLDPISDIDKAPYDTQCSNLSLFATSSVPYFDGEVKNRGPLIADGSDTIVIE